MVVFLVNNTLGDGFEAKTQRLFFLIHVGIEGVKHWDVMIFFMWTKWDHKECQSLKLCCGLALLVGSFFSLTSGSGGKICLHRFRFHRNPVKQ
jgi:hypothetical protein